MKHLTEEQKAKLHEAAKMFILTAVSGFDYDVSEGKELDTYIQEELIEPFIEPLINGELGPMKGESVSNEKMKLHVYIFHDDDDGDIITDIWACSVPDVGDDVFIWCNSKHCRYQVTKRIYRINADEKSAAWNLYVKPKKRKL
jgi:hypothetical protein